MKETATPEELAARFLDGVAKRRLRIGVIGLGYVGLPLILGFHEVGFPTLGFDIDDGLVSDLKAGKSRIAHIPSEKIQNMIDSGRFSVTTDYSQMRRADAILICVPTPLGRHREPDLSFIRKTAETMAPHLRPGQLIILESTTYPGTTRDVLGPILEKGSGLRAERDFFLAYSPEREDPGNPDYSTRKIPKVVGSASSEGEAMAVALYETLVPRVVRVANPETAEAVKLTENIFRAVNIALVNELKMIYASMGIDVWEVIDAAATKPFGFMPFYPGPGWGGHCIPIDPFYLTWKAREFGHHTHFIELAGEINTNMPRYVVQKLTESLSRYRQKALKGARILIVGVAYKKNVDDMRESPALVLMKLLTEQGCEISYFDPYVHVIPPTREHAEFAGMKSLTWEADALRNCDAALIATDHDCIDWQLLVDNVSLIVDTRNALKDATPPKGHVILKA